MIIDKNPQNFWNLVFDFLKDLTVSQLILV